MTQILMIEDDREMAEILSDHQALTPMKNDLGVSSSNTATLKQILSD